VEEEGILTGEDGQIMIVIGIGREAVREIDKYIGSCG
jgi:hypothetical protein